MSSPNVTLLLGPASGGKTTAALRACAAHRQGRALLLVPGRPQQQALRQQVGCAVYQFYGLASHILHAASHPEMQRLRGVGRTLLLRDVVRDLRDAGRLPTFAAVAEKPGMLATLDRLIAEAQDAEVAPEALAAAGLTPYDAELGAIFAAYRERLHVCGQFDTARRLELARETLHDPAHAGLLRGVGLLVVDGFDEFTSLQLSLLAALAAHLPHLLITLTSDPARPRPAHRRFNRTYQALVERLNPRIETLPVPYAGPLAPIEARLFDLDAAPIPADALPSAAVHIISAADREREVRAALRRVRRLLDAGTPPAQVALLLRGAGPYVPLLHEVAREYGIRLSIAQGLPLAEEPAIAVRLTLLRLPLEDYPARAVGEVWRALADGRLPAAWGAALATSPPDFGRAASLLERGAREAGIVGGLEHLRAALRRMAEAEPPDTDPDADDLSAPPLTPAAAAEVLGLLEAFAERLNPPPQATPGAYLAWLRGLELTPEPATPDAASPADAGLHARAQALRRWSALLADLEEAAALLDEEPVRYADVLADLAAATSAVSYQPTPPDEPAAEAAARVRVLPVLGARGLHVDHLLLLGMVDGEFPLRLPDPLFYTRRERALLARRGVVLPPADPADERSLFYETVAGARRSLTLCTTYLDEQGNPLNRSPYVAALLALLPDSHVTTQKIAAGSVPALDEAVSPQERLVALLDSKAPPQVPDDLAPLYAHVRRACAIEAAREDATQGYGPYEGALHDDALREELLQHFGPEYIWTVTQFNDYITCPFRFAAAHLLHLEQRADPEEGLERAGRGLLYHKILAHAGRTWNQENIPLHKDHAAALDALDAAATRVLAEVSAQPDFVQGAFWEWEQHDVRRRLERAIRHALSQDDEWSAFRVAAVEKGFGMKHGAVPLTLETEAGPVQVRGRIDRLDQHAETRSLAVIDYKSGSTARSVPELKRGRDVQLAIYMLAAEHVMGSTSQSVERAAFFLLGKGALSPPLSGSDRDTAISAMRERVAEVVRGAQAGDFAVRPRDKCPTFCAFASICRLNLAKRDKQAE
jgi:ATP-dependent helicase/DNAse subunit B